METIPIKTSLITPEDRLEDLLDQYVTVEEQSIVAITSKIISVIQGRYQFKNTVSKELLIKQEADQVFNADNPYGCYLTITHNALLPSAGIDESNAGDCYILLPRKLQETAAELWRHLRQTRNLKNVGVLITDSHTTPLRRGVTGIGLGWCGFQPVHSLIGQKDLFGRPLKMTTINIVDALAVAAVFVMGEGYEKTPFAVLKNLPSSVVFSSAPPTQEEMQNYFIPLEEDLYSPLFRKEDWIKKN